MSRGSWVISCKIYWDPSKSQITAQRCVMPCIKPDLKLWIARICRKKKLPHLCPKAAANDLQKTSRPQNLLWKIWISPEIILNLSKISSQLLKNVHPQAWKKCKKNALPLWNTSLLFVFIVVSRPPKPRNWDLLTMAACQAIWIHLVVWDGLGYHQIWWKQADDGSWRFQKTHLKKFAQVKVDHSLTLILDVRCLKIWWT